MEISNLNFCLRCEEPYVRDDFEFCPECRGKITEEERRMGE